MSIMLSHKKSHIALPGSFSCQYRSVYFSMSKWQQKNAKCKGNMEKSQFTNMLLIHIAIPSPKLQSPSLYDLWCFSLHQLTLRKQLRMFLFFLFLHENVYGEVNSISSTSHRLSFPSLQRRHSKVGLALVLYFPYLLFKFYWWDYISRKRLYFSYVYAPHSSKSCL